VIEGAVLPTGESARVFDEDACNPTRDTGRKGVVFGSASSYCNELPTCNEFANCNELPGMVGFIGVPFSRASMILLCWIGNGGGLGACTGVCTSLKSCSRSGVVDCNEGTVTGAAEEGGACNACIVDDDCDDASERDVCKDGTWPVPSHGDFAELLRTGVCGGPYKLCMDIVCEKLCGYMMRIEWMLDEERPSCVR
jgi:hypothetical protein